MGRSLSSTMASIFAGTERQIDWTLELSFPDTTVFRFATAPLSIGKGDFTNDLESVSELRQTIEAPADRVGIALQNKDRVLGLHVATYWQQWRRAEAVIGRYYAGGVAFASVEWKEMFRGVVQQPNANDLQVTFDVLHDTISPGQIVCNDTEALACGWVFKDPKTCAYTGSETDCNHNLKSKGGCLGRSNTHHFGGMEHYYNPDLSTPGTGGNTGGSGGHPPCPRLDQYVLVKGPDGKPLSKMVCFFTEQDELWNPVTKRFHKTRSIEIVPRQPIFEIITSNGAIGYSSRSHPILWYKEHAGVAVGNFVAGDPVLGWARNKLVDTRALIAQDTGEVGDVMRIEMVDGKIYCYGDNPEKMIVCHNYKPEEPL